LFQITRAAILAGLIITPQAVFSQTVSSPTANDDHSYLPPSMQGQPQASNQVEAKNGTPAAEAPAKKGGKVANQHVRRDHHYYAEDSGWANFDD
jgi:hypothetical protein